MKNTSHKVIPTVQSLLNKSSKKPKGEFIVLPDLTTDHSLDEEKFD